jgi:hypothetical protein
MSDTVTTQQLLQFLGVLVGSGAAVTVVAQVIKKALGLKSKGVIHVMVIGVTALASAAQYVLTLKNIPVEVLGISGTAIWGASQAYYKAAPAIVNFLTKEEAAVDGKATQADKEVAAVSVPTALTSEPEATPAVETPAPAAPAAPADDNTFNG